MIGSGHEELGETYTGEFTLNAKADAPVVLEVNGLSFERSLSDVSFEIRAGEVLGVYGFMGCGRRGADAGALRQDQARPGCWRSTASALRLSSTSKARSAGLAFVPESRRLMLFHHEPIYKNATISILKRISALWLKPQKEREIAARHVEALRIKTGERRHAARRSFRAATSRRWRWRNG